MKALRRGDRGSEVTFLQERLNRHGFTVRVDGDFGDKTDLAVEQFQASGGLRVDGIVGPKTWDALLVERRIVPTSLDEHDWLMEIVETANLPGGGSRVHALRKAVVSLAIADIGRAEKPDGSNGGPMLAEVLLDGEGRTYWEAVGLGGEGRPAPPWCSIFVSNVIRRVLEEDRTTREMRRRAFLWPETPMGAWFGAVRQWEEWAKASTWLGEGDEQSPHARTSEILGAVGTMARLGSSSDPSKELNAGHNFFVVAVDAADSSRLITVEGNVSNRVQWRRRERSEVRMLIPWWLALDGPEWT